MNFNKTVTAVALPLIAISSMLSAARNNKAVCAPEPPVTCYPDDCQNCYCLGPTNYAANAAVRPRTCNGDLVITVAGFYWNAHEDGLEYAILSQVGQTQAERVNIIDAKFLNPEFKWDFGFKLGLGYNTTCDGWDINVLWTHYRGKAFTHVESEADDNTVLLPIWSNYAIVGQTPTFATDIDTRWELDLDLVDIELGREFWNSRRLSIRPHIGIRVAFIRQEYDLFHKGGTWSATSTRFNDTLELENDFKGAGVRGGLDTVWNLGCGWAIYGNLAISAIYGRFNVDNDEYIREAETPFTKTKILELMENFRVSRFATDLGLGLQWSAMFCKCKYGITAQLGWEHHLFLNQNQLWRVNKLESNGFLDNVYNQRRGDLDTQGWTLTIRFEF